jgi:hypothetical protein
MKEFGAIQRRDVLAAAGAGLAISLLGGAGARAQTLALDSASGVDPATSWFNGKLYALWKDPGNGGELEYAFFDGSTWSLQVQIPKANSSVPPSLATFENKLYAAWKGRGADQRVWYSAFDGSQWSPQAQIPSAATLGGPALSVFNNKLYAVWKGAAAALSSASFDGSKWSNTPRPVSSPVAANTHPFSPQLIASTALSGVDQGKYGDCVFQAAVVATATTARGQLALSKSIMQNADGSFTVTFAGDPQHPVKLTENQLITTQVHDNAKWAQILEAALVISDPEFANGSRPPKNTTAGSPAIYALNLLTGSPASKDVARSPMIGKRIAQALGKGQPVIAFCANNDEGALISGHEWTVISCNSQGSQITLRNPWGNFKTAGTSKGGILYDGNAEVSMSLQQFGQFYDEVTFGYEKA